MRTPVRGIRSIAIAGAGIFLFAALAAAGQQAGASQPLASISGSLLDGTGRPLADVPLTLLDPANGQKHETRTDAAGGFSIGRIPAGDYQIQVSKPGFEPVAGRVLLAPGQEVRREVVPRIVGLKHSYKVSAKSAGGPAPQRTVLSVKVPDDRCKGTTSGGCLTPPTRVVEAWPVYPRPLAEKGVAGTVDIQARLGTDGFLADFRPNDGADPALAQSAIEALRVWEYTPLRLNGVPQEGRMTVTFRFEIGGH